MHIQEDQLQAIIAAILKAGTEAGGKPITARQAAADALDLLAAIHQIRMQQRTRV